MVKPRVKQGIFDRYFIFHPNDDRMAWSGARWVPCWPDGRPVNIQVCNFANIGDAKEYARSNPLIELSLENEQPEPPTLKKKRKK